MIMMVVMMMIMIMMVNYKKKQLHISFWIFHCVQVNIHKYS